MNKITSIALAVLMMVMIGTAKATSLAGAKATTSALQLPPPPHHPPPPKLHLNVRLPRHPRPQIRHPRRPPGPHLRIHLPPAPPHPPRP
ncbi:hypothetical protein ABZR88_19240 [Mucilaginibacter yixingensis]|uniref:hypothetical protein n=1 Tax=Mucilaginibacter yixingensis TaxID=1295612 RepID=UPI0011B28E82|nr:hypothetical protein [Mucilaginibacter yixingensis]